MIHDPILTNDWLVTIPVRDLDQTGVARARLLEEDLVIWRSADGEIMAWKDLCLHRGVRLSLGEVQEGDKLQCPYHGWTYDKDGKCVKMPAHPEQEPPAKAVVQTYHVQVKYDWVWVCLGEPTRDLPVFPEWEDESFRRVLCGPYFFNAAGPRMIENFLDVAHFPYVHENILGTRERPEIQPYEVTVDENGVCAHDIKVYQPNPDGTGEGKDVSYTYHAFRPLIAYFRKKTEGPQFAMFMAVNPMSEQESNMLVWMVMNHSYDASEADLVAFQDEISYQDVPIVESQRPELLPLDLQAELHLRSDKTAIAYRKWLNDMGLSFGTE